MAKVHHYRNILDRLQRIIPTADLSSYGALSITNADISNYYVQVLDEILTENSKFFTGLVISGVKSERSINMSWIKQATNLAKIDIEEKTWMHGLLEAIIENDNLVNASFHYSKYDKPVLRNKVDNLLKIRIAKYIELKGSDNPKFAQLGFNDFTHTWLPYDAISRKWKLSDLTYDQYAESFNLPALQSPPPQGVNLSKIEIMKANHWASIGGMKHELQHRKSDLQILTSERDVLIESIEANPEDALALDEFATKSGLIGRHKKHVSSLKKTIPIGEADVVAKLAAQKTLDQKWFEALSKQDISAMKLALAQGADLHARNELGKTAQEMLSTQIEKVAAEAPEALEALITLLTQIQDEQNAVSSEAKLASVFVGSSSASAAGSIDMPPIGLDEFQADDS